MRIKEYIIIDRAREIVWEHIHDPKYMKTWNPRIRRFEPGLENLPSLDYKFSVVYEILGKPESFDGVIVEYSKNKRLGIKYLSRDNKYKGYIFEGFELADTKRGTKLCHYFDLKNSGINIFIRLLLYILGFLARPIGKRYLASLKTAIQQ